MGMTPTKRRDQGQFLIEALVALLLGMAVFIYVLAAQQSEEQIFAEKEAISILNALVLAQEEFRQALVTGGQQPRYGTLSELLGIAGPPFDSLEIGIPLRQKLEIAERMGFRFQTESYCYTAYLVDAQGIGIEQIGPNNVDDSFFIAYAWPRKVGARGRRVYAVDSFGVLRAWDNRIGDRYGFEGADHAPPAQLAPPPENQNYPMALEPKGPQRTFVWKLLNEPEN